MCRVSLVSVNKLVSLCVFQLLRLPIISLCITLWRVSVFKKVLSPKMLFHLASESLSIRYNEDNEAVCVNVCAHVCKTLKFDPVTVHLCSETGKALMS